MFDENLKGISIEDVEITLSVGGKSFKETGPILITHWGFSGPAIIRLSAFAARDLYCSKYKAELRINEIYRHRIVFVAKIRQFFLP